MLPVGISVDSPANLKIIEQTHDVGFPLLSDQDLSAHNAFYVVNHLDDQTMTKLTGFGFDVEGWSERDHHTVAIPSLFLIDEQRVVRFAHAAHDHRTRPGTDQLLTAIEQALADRVE